MPNTANPSNTNRPEYTLYIDECGNHDLYSARERYLGLTGVICERRYVATEIAPSMEALKRCFWPDPSTGAVVLHRKDIVTRRGPFGVLNDVTVQARFDEELLGLLARWNYTVLSVVIDKHAHRERYARPYHPYHYCLNILLERYVGFLRHVSQRGNVLAEARNRTLDRELSCEYEAILSRGSGFGRTNVSASEYQAHLTSRRLGLAPKTANDAGLQLADLLAHEARAEVLDHYGHVPLRSHPFQDRVIEVIRAKYYRKPENGQIDGCGRKMLP